MFFFYYNFCFYFSISNCMLNLSAFYTNNDAQMQISENKKEQILVENT